MPPGRRPAGPWGAQCLLRGQPLPWSPGEGCSQAFPAPWPAARGLCMHPQTRHNGRAWGESLWSPHGVPDGGGLIPCFLSSAHRSCRQPVTLHLVPTPLPEGWEMRAGVHRKCQERKQGAPHTVSQGGQRNKGELDTKMKINQCRRSCPRRATPAAPRGRPAPGHRPALISPALLASCLPTTSEPSSCSTRLTGFTRPYKQFLAPL